MFLTYLNCSVGFLVSVFFIHLVFFACIKQTNLGLDESIVQVMKTPFSNQRRPWGLKWRSSVWFVTLVVGCGVMVDLLVYSVIIPVVPFQLEKMGYHSATALTAWLLFAYSITLVTFSLVCSWFSERYHMRRAPLLWGQLSLIGFLILFMEAPNYAVMVVARAVQGVSSSVIWVIGLALLTDTVPEEKAGQQLGLAMSGSVIGMLAGPPIGGVLYDKLGFRAPFIFGIIITALDLIGRILIIERKDALKWGHDPSATSKQDGKEVSDAGREYRNCRAGNVPEQKAVTSEKTEEHTTVLPVPAGPTDSPTPDRLPELQVWKFLLTSRRTMVALMTILTFSIVFTGLEPTLAIRLQDIYGFNAAKVGLVILASAVAAVFASPLSGWISDRFGTEWITFLCLLFSIPWYILLLIRGPIALFTVCFALSNFFLAGLVSPLIAELASVVRKADGVGFGHIYGFFNMTYGVGTAVGPIVAGHVYSKSREGWTILIAYGAVLLFLCVCVNLFYGGEHPLASRIRRKSNTIIADQNA